MKKLLSGLMKKKNIKSLSEKDKSLKKVINKEIIDDYNLIERIKNEIENNTLKVKGTLADKLFIKIFESAKSELDHSYYRFVSRINRLTEYGLFTIQPEDSAELEPERKEFASRYHRMKQCLMLKESFRVDYGFSESQIEKSNTSLTRLRELIDEEARLDSNATKRVLWRRRYNRDIKLGKKPQHELSSFSLSEKEKKEIHALRDAVRKELDKLKLEIDEFERSLLDNLVDSESIILAQNSVDEFYAMKDGEYYIFN